MRKSSNQAALNAKFPFIPETLRFPTFSLMIGPSNACRFRPKRLGTLSTKIVGNFGKVWEFNDQMSWVLIYEIDIQKHTSNIQCIVTQRTTWSKLEGFIVLELVQCCGVIVSLISFQPSVDPKRLTGPRLTLHASSSGFNMRAICGSQTLEALFLLHCPMAFQAYQSGSICV